MNYINWNQFEERSKWTEKQETYGFAYTISKKMVLTAITIFCLITPFTNWLIPIAVKTIKTGITLRWS